MSPGAADMFMTLRLENGKISETEGFTPGAGSEVRHLTSTSQESVRR